MTRKVVPSADMIVAITGRELILVRSRRDHRVWYLRHLMENRCRMRMRMRMTTLIP